jgi:hypothetical protein
MIKTEPGKRISLGTVVKRLENLFPPSATGYDNKDGKEDQATQDADDETSHKSISKNQDIERGNVSKTTVSCPTSFEKIEEVNYCS